MSAITVAIVEDDPVFLQRFEQLVQAAPTLALSGVARSYGEGLALLDQMPADVYMIDLGLPGGSGIDLIRIGNRRHPRSEFMVVSVFGDDDHVIASIEAGATGYLLKDSSVEQLVECVSMLRQGGAPITPSIARKLLMRFRRGGSGPGNDAGLTERQDEILQLLAKGLRFSDIARALGISAHTVTAHVRVIYEKLEVSSRGEAVFEAQQRRLIRH